MKVYLLLGCVIQLVISIPLDSSSYNYQVKNLVRNNDDKDAQVDSNFQVNSLVSGIDTDVSEQSDAQKMHSIQDSIITEIQQTQYLQGNNGLLASVPSTQSTLTGLSTKLHLQHVPQQSHEIFQQQNYYPQMRFGGGGGGGGSVGAGGNPYFYPYYQNINPYHGSMDQQHEIDEQNIYVHLPSPRQPNYYPNYRMPPPRKHYKIILVRSPTPVIPTPIVPEVEEKTIVYVLVKKPDLPTVDELQVAQQQSFKSHKPEVYFIKYKSNSNEMTKTDTSNQLSDINSNKSDNIPLPESDVVDAEHGQGSETQNSGYSYDTTNGKVLH